MNQKPPRKRGLFVVRACSCEATGAITSEETAENISPLSEQGGLIPPPIHLLGSKKREAERMKSIKNPHGQVSEGMD